MYTVQRKCKQNESEESVKMKMKILQVGTGWTVDCRLYTVDCTRDGASGGKYFSDNFCEIQMERKQDQQKNGTNLFGIFF